MKSKKAKLPVDEIESKENLEAQFPDSEIVPLEEEADGGVCAILRRMSHRGNYESSGYAYQDVEEDDYVSEEALHRVVEDLQFGHDLRM
jgi:hypothetical protein